MAFLIPNDFSQWQLSESEEKEGAKLTITQKQFIQNQIAAAAQSKLNLTFDTTNPQAFIQEEAFIAGQISAMKYLLDCSATAEESENSENQ